MDKTLFSSVLLDPDPSNFDNWIRIHSPADKCRSMIDNDSKKIICKGLKKDFVFVFNNK